MILGLKSHSSIHISPIPLTTPIRKPQTTLKPSIQFPPNQTHLQLKSRRTNPNGFKSSSSKESIGNDGGGNAGAEDDLKEGGGDELPRVDLKWNELVLDPDRDNVVAVGLMGALVWASVRVMWQVFVVTMAILIAAVKYTFVGVVLIFVVITLL